MANITTIQRQYAEMYQATFDQDDDDEGDSQHEAEAWQYIQAILDREKKGNSTAKDIKDCLFYGAWLKDYEPEIFEGITREKFSSDTVKNNTIIKF